MGVATTLPELSEWTLRVYCLFKFGGFVQPNKRNNAMEITRSSGCDNPGSTNHRHVHKSLTRFYHQMQFSSESVAGL